jgi:hypothetical protein
MNLNSRESAYSLLDELGAPNHLKLHVSLVGEAADLLIEKCNGLGVSFDSNFVQIGVAIHDIGKIIHTEEMTGPGSEHEPEGEKILLSKNIDPKIARCCLSHARWKVMSCSLEELLIALSDKLWKGKRVEELELKVIDKISESMGKDRWAVFEELDSHFEYIASSGHDRLQRSVGS